MQQLAEAVGERVGAIPREVLTLRLGNVAFGIDISHIQEIRSYEQPSRIPGAPPRVLGVSKFHDALVPIFDLRTQFGLTAEYGSSTATVVLRLGNRTVGVVVDAVSDVLTLAPDQLKPVSEFSGGLETTHISGFAILGEGEGARILVLVNIEGLFAAHESELESLGPAA